jgi:hypothetical protein
VSVSLSQSDVIKPRGCADVVSNGVCVRKENRFCLREGRCSAAERFQCAGCGQELLDVKPIGSRDHESCLQDRGGARLLAGLRAAHDERCVVGSVHGVRVRVAEADVPCRHPLVLNASTNIVLARSATHVWVTGLKR